jgi:sugar fermentation stimulation protein A
MQFDELVEGRLLKRYKRFLADVELADGSVITAHCPNTGAMTGCAEPGSPVWLSVSASKTRKYPHTWELVQTDSGLACIHSARANKVVAEAFRAGHIAGYEAYPQLRTEVKYGQGSRIDLLLEGEPGSVFVEVKCVTLAVGAGTGLFPDAVSERGRKHIVELQQVAREADARAVLLFCVFHNGIERVSAAGEIDPLYRQALAQAMEEGVEVQAWRALVSTGGIELTHALPFTLDPVGAC